MLLGPTLSGKTSLMRLMAGLDAPTSGTVCFDGKDVTGVPVQQRAVAMVYQQFINYPTMTVYENIASPLRVAGAERRRDRHARCSEAAALLKLTPLLRAHAAQPFRRPAAAHRAGPRHRQGRRPGAARRAARQSRLQAARGTARGAAAHLCREPARSSSMRRPSRTRRCCSAAIPRRCRRAASRSSGRPIEVFRQAERSGHGADLLRSAAQHASCCARTARSFQLDGGVNLPVPAELAGIADGQLHDRLSAPPSLSDAAQRGRRAGHRQGVGDRDHRLGKLRASRFRRRALGDAGARRARSSSRTRRSRCSSIRGTSWCSTQSGRSAAAPRSGWRHRGRAMARIDLDHIRHAYTAEPEVGRRTTR